MSTTIPSNVFGATTNTFSSDPGNSMSKSLGEQDFLTLLVKQMTSQDPMDPQKDTDFIAQMAQFSSLEQTKTMESVMSTMSTSQQATQANSLLGQTVTLQVDKSTTAQGVVSAVDLSAGTPKLVINGSKYDLSQVITVTNTPVQ